MRLYGKDKICGILSKTARQNRLSHAVLLTGKSGVGKKYLARYVAQLILCKHNACGECACCKNIENDTHPDVVFARKKCGGKYSAEPFRELMKDAVILPNNGKFKVYIFEECDTMTPVIYNALLKIIEEPAEHLRFVFTCTNTALVPETIMSRVTVYEVADTTVEDCERYLIDSGVEEQKAKELSAVFSGNIGECVNFLNYLSGNEKNKKTAVETARKIASAIASRDAYSASALISTSAEKSDFYIILDYLTNVFRDAIAIKHGQTAEYYDKESAQKIAGNFTDKEITRMTDTAFEISSNEIYNINPALTASYFISGIL